MKIMLVLTAWDTDALEDKIMSLVDGTKIKKVKTEPIASEVAFQWQVTFEPTTIGEARELLHRFARMRKLTGAK